MKTIVLSLYVLASLVYLTECQDKFTDKYDHIDLDDALKNDRLLVGYYKCLKDNVGCNAEGKELRKSIPLALNDECAKCTDRQRIGAEKVIKYLYKNKPDYWKELEKLYDPEGTFREKYKERYEQIKKEAS